MVIGTPNIYLEVESNQNKNFGKIEDSMIYIGVGGYVCVY